MVDIDALHKELTSHVDELTQKFLATYIPADPSIPPESYAHDVKAYCMLSHAAFEEFFEGIALSLTEYATNKWLAERKVNDILIALLCWHGAKMKIDDDETSPEKRPFEYLRPLVDSAKVSFSREVHKNHGVSILYLRGLLVPVGIEIPQDANWLNSLSKLAEGRGSYAHKGRVKIVLAPEDAQRYVRDVLALCNDVRAKAMGKMQELE
ncbi:MAG TPA: HEPN domain-containing protein [Nitrospira sp.]|jgi:hypothetical protein|nr:HEPN domain-containing protein [Nitrospira sp.]